LNYPLPDGAAEDSINILPALLDSTGGQLQRPALIADTGNHVSDRASFSIRKGAWKLLEIVPRPAEESQTIRYELYNLDTDPYETADLSEKQPEILQDMQTLLLACKIQGLRLMKNFE
jgi:arylsulfatase A-like enzyme